MDFDYSDYISFMHEREMSPTTIIDYTNTLRRYFAANGKLDEEGIRNFLKGHTASTRAKYRKQLKSVCRYYDVPIDWYRRVPPVKVTDKAPLTISKNDQTSLYKVLRMQSELHADAFIFLIETGLRISEIASLTPDSYLVDGDDAVVVIGKEPGVSHSAQGRYVPLTARARRIIERYGLPFAIDRRRFNAALVAARRQLCLPEYKIHTARKTFMSRNLARGVNVVDLASIMGHKNLDVMLKYASRSRETVVNAFKRPRKEALDGAN